MGGTEYIKKQSDDYFDDQIKKMINKSPVYETLQNLPDDKVKKVLEDIFYEEKSNNIEYKIKPKFKLLVACSDKFYNEKKRKILKK